MVSWLPSAYCASTGNRMGTFALMPGDVRPEDMPVVKPLIEGLIGYERLRAEEESS